MDRRAFLKLLAGVTASGIVGWPVRTTEAATQRDRLGELLPTRPLGKTGEHVTMLGVGGWHIGRMSERDAQETIERALEGGVRFFDTAEQYQSGGSESRLGKLLVPKYRDVVFLMTKTTARDAKTARAHLDASLKRLGTDVLDLWQIHAITSAEDVDGRIENGVLDVLREAKEKGRVRYIGFTGHTRPAAHRRMLEHFDGFDASQMPVNAVDPSYESFIEGVLPLLVEKGIGVIAMKSLANGGFFGGSQHGQHGDRPHLVPDRLTMREAIHFVWSWPVSVLVTGPDDPDQMSEKIALAKSFATMDEGERTALISRLAEYAGRRTEFYKG